MERRSKIGLILLIAAALISAEGVWAAVSITVTGSWFLTVDENALVGGPGSELRSTYESAADQVSITIRGGGNKDWHVDVRKVQSDWQHSGHAHVNLLCPTFLKRDFGVNRLLKQRFGVLEARLHVSLAVSAGLQSEGNLHRFAPAECLAFRREGGDSHGRFFPSGPVKGLCQQRVVVFPIIEFHFVVIDDPGRH